jgi:RNA polymerase sigma-70 factor (ECF subfamily)
MPDDDLSLQWVKQIQQGIDVEVASRKLFERHRRTVLFFFTRKGFSHEESRDLTQEVFVRVFKSIATFRLESSFGRWLAEIYLNIYRNEIRRRKADKRDALEQPLADEGDSDSDSGGILLASEEPSALDCMMKEERQKAFRLALEELPVQMRTCCILRYAKDLKYHEIAAVMKISIETVKAHLHQARKRLMAKLGPSGGEGGQS